MKRIIVAILMLVAFLATSSVQAEISCTKEDPCKSITLYSEGDEFVAPQGHEFVSTKTHDICVVDFEEVEDNEYFYDVPYWEAEDADQEDEDKNREECVSKGHLSGFWLTLSNEDTGEKSGMLFGIHEGGSWKYFSYFSKYGEVRPFYFPEMTIVTTEEKVIKSIKEIPINIKEDVRRVDHFDKITEIEVEILTSGYEQPEWVHGCVYNNYPKSERVEGEWVFREYKIILKEKCSDGNPVDLTLLKKSGSSFADGYAIRDEQLLDGKKEYGLYFHIEYETVFEVTKKGEEKPETTDDVIRDLQSPNTETSESLVSDPDEVENTESCSETKTFSQEEVDAAAGVKAQSLFNEMASDLERRAMDKFRIEKVSTKKGVEAVVKNVRNESLGKKNVIEEVRTDLGLIELCPLSSPPSCKPVVKVTWKNVEYSPDICREVARFQPAGDSDVDFLNTWRESFCSPK